MLRLFLYKSVFTVTGMFIGRSLYSFLYLNIHDPIETIYTRTFKKRVSFSDLPNYLFTSIFFIFTGGLCGYKLSNKLQDFLIKYK